MRIPGIWPRPRASATAPVAASPTQPSKIQVAPTIESTPKTETKPAAAGEKSNQMASFKSFLSAFGADFVKVFSFLGSAQGQAVVTGVETTAAVIATSVNPAAGAAVSAVEALVNAALKQVIAVESVAAAAGQQAGTGAQKAAAVITSITPQVGVTLAAAGVPSPTAEQIQSVATAVNNSVVAILNSIPAPVVAAAPAA